MSDAHDFPFSESQIRAVLGSAEGKKLLSLLQQDGGERLKQAAAAIKSGNYASAQTILEPVMQTQEASELVQKINKAREK